jgi:hypothetical protein
MQMSYARGRAGTRIGCMVRETIQFNRRAIRYVAAHYIV